MKLIGIDYGRRRIGVAVTDETGMVVRSLATIDTRGCDPFDSLCKTIRQEAPDALVVGIALGGNEQETSMSRQSRAFGQKLAGMSGLPLHFVEESFTSERARNILRYRRKKKRRDKTAVDRVAACLILEHFIQEHETE